jgi:hypothetical protein
MVRFSYTRQLFSDGSKVAGINVGGMNAEEVEALVTRTYTSPIEIDYRGSTTYLNPTWINFQIDIQQMVTDATKKHDDQDFDLISEFWNFLIGKEIPPQEIPLMASYSQQALKSYLEDELAGRYDISPEPTIPILGTTNFQSGSFGSRLDIERAVPLIEEALLSPDQRWVDLPVNRVDPPRPPMSDLELMLKSIIDSSGFDGLTDLFLVDLYTFEESHFIYQLGRDFPTYPDVAFTASGTIKIPILVSAFRQSGDIPEQNELERLIYLIINPDIYQTDIAIKEYIDSYRGPLVVTEDMRELGLKNTFIAGFFSPGSSLLDIINTPGNQRRDVSTNPDLFNQTSPTDLGKLLQALYLCGKTGEGIITEIFKGKISRTECHLIINYLSRNQLVSLIGRGVPDDADVVHMHGWETESGIMYTLGDAAILYTPGGDYVLVIFFYQPVQLIWGPVTGLVRDLSQAVYNYFNIHEEY